MNVRRRSTDGHSARIDHGEFADRSDQAVWEFGIACILPFERIGVRRIEIVVGCGSVAQPRGCNLFELPGSTAGHQEMQSDLAIPAASFVPSAFRA